MQITIKDGIATNRAFGDITIKEEGAITLEITDKAMIKKLQSGDWVEDEFKYKDGNPIGIKSLKESQRSKDKKVKEGKRAEIDEILYEKPTTTNAELKKVLKYMREGI